MTAKLFVALYVGLFVGMFILFFTNFAVAWVFFAFVFVAIFGGLWLIDRLYVIAAGFLLVSLIVLGVAVYSMLQSPQMNNWPTAAGAITRSWMCSRWTNGQTVYSGPCIEYHYSVDEQAYQVSSIDTGEFADRGLWWGIAGIPEQYRVDRAVKVYYDPSHHGISRLDPGIPARDWITAIIGGTMAALSALTLWWVVFKRTPADTSIDEFKAAQPIYAARQRRAPGPVKTIPDIGDQLEKLAHLHEKGDLTDKEYEQAKKKLLGPPVL